ncbi:MAG: peptidase C45 [Phycisphaerae bacterium]|jgi:predicted choloylglycine hydrolase
MKPARRPHQWVRFAVILAVAWAAPTARAEDAVTVIAREGRGALLEVNGARVCLLAGEPEEMGYQHGVLLKDQIREMVQKTLLIARTSDIIRKENPFAGSIEEAFKRTEKFTPPRYLKELEGLAKGAGLPVRSVQASNIFPELFHCSGFALSGEATKDGELLHGRVLDYMTEIGLQDQAVVFVCKPAGYHAFINVGYSGFIGSVTGMNEKGVSFGEMGGRGEGQWDGVPMGYLMRMGMEQADDLDEAVRIFREARRTCQYYYVIADGNRRDAVGLACEPDRFEVIRMGAAHAQLPRPVKDTVLMSAGDRYDHLVDRVKEKYGQFTPDLGEWLMTRPVAMSSNLHCVLFKPKTGDVWFANAGNPRQSEKFQACWQPYRHLNLRKLLALIPDTPGAAPAISTAAKAAALP